MWLALAVIGGVLLAVVWRRHKAKQAASVQTAAPTVATAPTAPPPTDGRPPVPASPVASPPAWVEPDPATLREAMRHAVRAERYAWAVPPEEDFDDEALTDDASDWPDDGADHGPAWIDADTDGAPAVYGDEAPAVYWVETPEPARSSGPVPWDPSTWPAPPRSARSASPLMKVEALKRALVALGLSEADTAAIAERLGFVVEQLSPAQIAALEARLKTASPDDLARLHQLLVPLLAMKGDETVLVAARTLLPVLMRFAHQFGGAL
jgi:hypothetical protein